MCTSALSLSFSPVLSSSPVEPAAEVCDQGDHKAGTLKVSRTGPRV